MQENVIVWVIVMIILIAIELATVGLYSVWFAVGALTALIFTLLHCSLLVQLLSFLIVSAALFFWVRPIMTKRINSTAIKTNTEALIGETGIVVADISEFSTGQVKINGVIWTARAEDDQPIPRDTKVTINRIEGVKLIVEREE